MGQNPYSIVASLNIKTIVTVTGWYATHFTIDDFSCNDCHDCRNWRLLVSGLSNLGKQSLNLMNKFLASPGMAMKFNFLNSVSPPCR